MTTKKQLELAKKDDTEWLNLAINRIRSEQSTFESQIKRFVNSGMSGKEFKRHIKIHAKILNNIANSIK
jgi:Fe-S cluster assembly ATPase SufC